MKKRCLLLVGLFSLQRASAETMSFSLGADYGIGAFEVDREAGTVINENLYRYHEKSNIILYAPAFSMLARGFAENAGANPLGFYFPSGRFI